MSVANRTIGIAVTFNGSPLAVSEFAVANEVSCPANDYNGGQRWAAVARKADIDPGTVDELDLFEVTVSVVELDGSGGAVESYSVTVPALVCPDPDESFGIDGDTVILQGVDEATYKLSQKGKALDTLSDEMFSDIVAEIATLADVTIVIDGGVTDWQVPDFDITGEAPLGSHLARLCRDAALCWRINQDGEVEIYAWEDGGFAGAGTLRYSQGTRRRRNSGVYKHLIYTGRSMQKAEYPFEITQSGVFNGDLSPGIDPTTAAAVQTPTANIKYVALFNASNGLCAYFQMAPDGPTDTPDSAGPAVSCTYEVGTATFQINGTLTITGSASNPPFGPTTYPATALDARERTLQIESTLWEDEDFADARAPYILASHNQDADAYSFESVKFDPRMWVADAQSVADRPDCCITRTEWKFDGKMGTMSVDGYAMV